MMHREPLVSVIIPVYNCEKYVESAVRSIMNQTYKNLEIIVTDDCSTDNSYQILCKLADEDSRIKLYRNKENLKLIKTLNNMISISKGEYIARMDADDISLISRIYKQVEFLEVNKEIGLCGTFANIINENDKIIDKIKLPKNNNKIAKSLVYMCPFYHPTVMVRAVIYKKNLYSEEWVHLEDYELWCRLAYLENVQMGILPERLFCYRKTSTQITQVYSDAQERLLCKLDQKYFYQDKYTFYKINYSLLNNEYSMIDFLKLCVFLNLQSYRTVEKIYKRIILNLLGKNKILASIYLSTPLGFWIVLKKMNRKMYE